MKQIAAVVLALLLCGALVSAKEIAFVDGYANALKMAQERNQPILITFYADW